MPGIGAILKLKAQACGIVIKIQIKRVKSYYSLFA